MLITLDAGHGGTDPGAVGNGLKEKDLTLQLVLGVGKILEQHGVNVHYTRKTDMALSLSDRSKLSNVKKATHFLSFHVNAGGGTGFESFRHPKADAKTKTFHESLHKELMKGFKAHGIKDRGIKTADHSVTRLTNSPAVLLEYLFIDTKSDSLLLKTKVKEFIDFTADALLVVLGITKKANAIKNQSPLYRVQVGAYSKKANAQALVNELKKKGYSAIIKEE